MSDSPSDISNKNLLDILLTLKEEGRKNKEEIKEQIKHENEKLLKVLEEQSEKIICLENKCTQLENKCLLYERKLRKNNLIIFGLSAPETNILEFTLNKLNELLNIQLNKSDINNVFTVNTEKGFHLKVEFTSYLTKSLVLKNAPKLKGTKIFIADDLCYEDRKSRKILIKHSKLAKSKNLFTKIIGNKLQISDEVYTIEQLNDMDSINKGNKEEERYIGEKSSSAPPTPNNFSTERESATTSTTPNKKDKLTKEAGTTQTTQEEKKRKLDNTPENKYYDVKSKKTAGAPLRTSSRNRS